MKIITKLQKVAPFAYFVLLLISCSIVTFIDAGYSFYSLTIWALTIIPVFIFWLLIPGKNFEIVRTYKPLFIICFIFSAIYFGSYFVYPFADFGYRDFIIYFTLFFVFLTSVTIKWQKIHLRWILRILCVLIFLLSIYGIYNYIFFPFYRVTGPYFISNKELFFPNAFAFLLMLLLPIQILYLFNQTTTKEWSLRKLYFYISSIVIFTAFFLIYSRASLIALIVLSIIFIVIQLKHAVRKKPFFRGKAIQMLLVVLIISFVSISLVNWGRGLNYEIGTIEEYLSLDASENTVSFTDRFDYMKGAALLAKDFPLFGIGANNFSFFYPEYQQNALLSDHPYNFILKVTSEIGIPMGIIILIFVVLIFVYGFRDFKDIEQKYYTGALAFALLASGIQSLIDYNINFVLNSAILGLFSGLYLSRFPIKKKKKSYVWKAFTTGFVLIFVFIISIVSIHELYGNKFNLSALAAYEQNDYKEAAQEYKKAGETRWFKEDFYIKRANIYQKLYEKNMLNSSEIEEWTLAGEEAVNAHPHNPDSWYIYGQALCACRSCENAVEKFEKAIELDSINHLEYYYDLIKCKNKINKLKPEDLFILKKRLTEFTLLLKENPYLINTSENHLYAEKIYLYLRDNLKVVDQGFIEEFNEFKKIISIYGGQERT